jgi:hypothetical protein
LGASLSLVVFIDVEIEQESRYIRFVEFFGCVRVGIDSREL